jgi:molybdopterin-guanine dinucleotide biosynthesis adapter protein
MMPKVFIFVGHSGSGKTTLIEKLLRELSSRGLRVATIKHAHHKVRLGHVTDETTSHSTSPSKDGGLVASYAEQSLARTAAGNPIPHQTLTRTMSGLQLDTPGKDSWRYKQAGAVISMLVTSNELQLVADAVDRREPEQLAQRFLGEADLVLAEGFSHAPGVKIEVLRRECSAVPRCAVEDGLIALVTDVDEVYPQLPHFALDDISGIIQLMLDYLPR